MPKEATELLYPRIPGWAAYFASPTIRQATLSILPAAGKGSFTATLAIQANVADRPTPIDVALWMAVHLEEFLDNYDTAALADLKEVKELNACYEQARNSLADLKIQGKEIKEHTSAPEIPIPAGYEVILDSYEEDFITFHPSPSDHEGMEEGQVGYKPTTPEDFDTAATTAGEEATTTEPGHPSDRSSRSPTTEKAPNNTGARPKQRQSANPSSTNTTAASSSATTRSSESSCTSSASPSTSSSAGNRVQPDHTYAAAAAKPAAPLEPNPLPKASQSSSTRPESDQWQLVSPRRDKRRRKSSTEDNPPKDDAGAGRARTLNASTKTSNNTMAAKRKPSQRTQGPQPSTHKRGAAASRRRSPSRRRRSRARSPSPRRARPSHSPRTRKTTPGSSRASSKSPPAKRSSPRRSHRSSRSPERRPQQKQQSSQRPLSPAWRNSWELSPSRKQAASHASPNAAVAAAKPPAASQHDARTRREPRNNDDQGSQHPAQVGILSGGDCRHLLESRRKSRNTRPAGSSDRRRNSPARTSRAPSPSTASPSTTTAAPNGALKPMTAEEFTNQDTRDSLTVMTIKYRRAKAKHPSNFQERMVFSTEEQRWLQNLWSSCPPSKGSVAPPRKHVTNRLTNQQEEILDCAAILRQFSAKCGIDTTPLE